MVSQLASTRSWSRGRRSRAFARAKNHECASAVAFARYLHVRFTGLNRDLDSYIRDYNHERVHHGRLPADIVYGANKVKPR
jgi:hypothetical protein